VLKNKSQITYEDLAHENPGCPENSICSKEMGEKMKKWSSFMESTDHSNAKSIETFRAKHGLPVSFLVEKQGILGIDPILYNSRCRHHNPKDKNKVVYVGTQFFRNNPKSEYVNFDKAWVDKEEYELPFEDVPLMIKDKKLVITRVYENKFFHLGIAKTGEWKVMNLSKKEINKAMQTLESTNCKEQQAPGRFHLKTFCKSIWDADLKKSRVVRLSWACH
tara:strand:- start:12714 stop:13373 length:660 start_codon:yes stop_codon:yes gene_type:complete